MEKSWRTGMVSVTYRKHQCEEIIALCKAAGLDGIEWGGDVHVPHGDVKAAKHIGEITRAAGLAVLSYGSYYQVGTYGAPQAAFADVIASAKALGAPVIRIWAGAQNSEEVCPAARAQMVAEVQAFADAAADEGLSLSFEFHGDTLTNTAPSAVTLIRETGRENVKLYWQPNQREHMQNKADLQLVLPFLTNVHVHWVPDGQRHMLAEGAAQWREYIEILRADAKPHDFMLEFVVEDRPENLAIEAGTLAALLTP